MEEYWIFKSVVGQPSPVKSNPVTPTKGTLNRSGTGVQEDFLKYYKDNGLEPLAREVIKLVPFEVWSTDLSQTRFPVDIQICPPLLSHLRFIIHEKEYRNLALVSD